MLEEEEAALGSEISTESGHSITKASVGSFFIIRTLEHHLFLSFHADAVLK